MILETLAISLSNLINFKWTCVAKPKRRTIWIPHFTARSLFKSCHIFTLAYFCSMSYSWEVLDTNLISSVYLVVHLACLLPVLYSMSANKSWFQKLSYLILIAIKGIDSIDPLSHFNFGGRWTRQKSKNRIMGDLASSTLTYSKRWTRWKFEKRVKILASSTFQVHFFLNSPKNCEFDFL